MSIDLIEKVLNTYFAWVPRFKPRNEAIQNALLIAHRGAHDNSQGIIENTLDAFRQAHKLGCWGVELDVRATSDNVLVVNHDPTLKRLWGHDVAIAELTFTALRTLEPKIPSLEEVIVELGQKTHLFIEIKSPFAVEQQLIEVLKDLIPCKHYHLLILDERLVEKLTHFPKRCILLVPIYNNVSRYCNLSITKGYGGVLGSYLLLTKKRIGLLKKANQVYGVGFVESKNSLYRELSKGISWIFTNKATTVGKYLRNLQHR